jgi:hypothetical protein
MGLWSMIFGKKDGRRGTSLCEVPITTVRKELPRNRNHPAFKTLRGQHPNIAEEHLDVLMRFAFASGVREKEGSGALAGFILGLAQGYKDGSFFVKKSGGKYCLYLAEGHSLKT